MIISPVATGNGAYIVHKNLEREIQDYCVIPYSPQLTFFPPLLYGVGRFQSADLIHTTPDYALFHARKNIPLVLTFHNYVLDSFMLNYSSLLQNIHYQTDLKWFSNSSVKKATAITAVSHFTAKLAKEELRLEKDIRVIYNGIDQNYFYPNRLKTTRNEVRVLFCGNLIQRKGAHWLEGIAERLSSNIKIFYTAGLRTKVTLPAHKSLESLGSIPHHAMPELYNDIDILLFPTVREGLSLAALEAMACGLPLVASNCSSMPELIDEGLGGFLCPIGDIQAFAERINQLAEDAILRRQMGEYNRAKVEKEFTLLQMVNKYKLLFNEVLDNWNTTKN